jgi:GT2 family glycosyltransferase
VDWDVVESRHDWSKGLNDIEVIEAPKPFIFSRNINLGINHAGDDDVVLLNDDAQLETTAGFSVLQGACREHPEYGLIAATTNSVGNLNQLPKGIGLREDPRMVCFIAVFIPRTTINRVGLLDERYDCYSHQDDDYCYRVRKAGLKIGIHDGSFVDHKHLPSTFRGHGARAEIKTGARIFQEIHGIRPEKS